MIDFPEAKKPRYFLASNGRDRYPPVENEIIHLIPERIDPFLNFNQLNSKLIERLEELKPDSKIDFLVLGNCQVTFLLTIWHIPNFTNIINYDPMTRTLHNYYLDTNETWQTKLLS